MQVTFAPGQGFHQELRRRVDDYFERTSFRRRDRLAMYVKAAVLLAWAWAGAARAARAMPL